MSARERFLAILLVVAMLGIGGAVAGYQFVFKPISESGDKLAKLDAEVQELDIKKHEMDIERFDYENRARKRSLPQSPQAQDVSFAQREYEHLLSHMLQRTKFVAPAITPRPPDNKTNVPMLGAKKPIYTKVDFDLQLKGELGQLVDFLYSFYRQPLLHQIRKVEITKPLGRRTEPGAPESRDLDMKLTIEALVLDRAENRGVLLPPMASVERLAGGAAAVAFAMACADSGQGSVFAPGGPPSRSQSSLFEYRRIAGKNIFFDPIARSTGEGETEPKGVDSAPYICLNVISHGGGRAVAMIWDRFNNVEYEIETNTRGQVKVTQFQTNRHVIDDEGNVLITRDKGEERPFLQLGLESSGDVRRYTVERILENELLLAPYDPAHDKLMNGAAPMLLGGAVKAVLPPSKLFVWRVGQMLVAKESFRAMHEVEQAGAMRELMTRPLEVDNEGDAPIVFSGSGDAPAEFKFPTGKKPDFKSMRKKGNRPMQ